MLGHQRRVHTRIHELDVGAPGEPGRGNVMRASGALTVVQDVIVTHLPVADFVRSTRAATSTRQVPSRPAAPPRLAGRARPIPAPPAPPGRAAAPGRPPATP